MKNDKRSSVSLGEKFHYLSMAIDEISRRPMYDFKTDVIGLACQFSSQPKLKREDFGDMLNMTVRGTVNGIKIENDLFIKKYNDGKTNICTNSKTSKGKGIQLK